MLHLRSFTGFSIYLECWNAFRFGQSNKFWKKSLDIQVWVLSRSSRGRPENVLGTSRINLPGTSLERQIKTSLGRHFRTSSERQIGTSLWRQIETSPGRSNRIFRGRPGDQYLPAGIFSYIDIYISWILNIKHQTQITKCRTSLENGRGWN